MVIEKAAEIPTWECSVMKIGKQISDFRYFIKYTTTKNIERIILNETKVEKDLGEYINWELLFKNHVAQIT